MKTKLFLINLIFWGLVFYGLAHAQEEKELLKTYECVTGDNEVKDKNDVVIEEITIVEKRVTWTLAEIESYISYYNITAEGFEAQAKEYRDAIKTLEDLKAKIEKKVDGIKLKAPSSKNL